MTERDFSEIQNYVREATGQEVRNVEAPREPLSWTLMQLSKKERKGKTPEQQQALRKEKYVNAGGKE